MKKPLGIHLEGCVYTDNGDDLSEEDFSNAFIEFIEARGWHFGGRLNQIDEEGNDAPNIS